MDRAESHPAAAFLLRLHRPEDRVALVIIARPSGAVRQRLTTAAVLASPRWQAWLRHLNHTERCDLFVSVNPLLADACRRTKSDIAEARHVFLDVDGDGDAVLARVRAHPSIPPPLVVVYSSPGRFQALWRVTGATSDDVEAIQRGLVAAFNGDVAATDVTRVCRLPGYLNWKHSPPIFVTAAFTDTATWALSRFPHPGPMDASLPGGVTRRRTRRAMLSQSERDWRAVRLALARGVDPDQLACELAKARQDKPRPADYAHRTVARAQSRLGPTLPTDAPWLPLTRQREPR